MSEQDVINFVKLSLQLQRESEEVMEWKNEPPSQINGADEGYYWAFSRQYNKWCVVRYTIDRWGQDCYFETGTQGDYSPNFYTKWLGPLPEPKG